MTELTIKIPTYQDKFWLIENGKVIQKVVVEIVIPLTKWYNGTVPEYPQKTLIFKLFDDTKWYKYSDIGQSIFFTKEELIKHICNQI